MKRVLVQFLGLLLFAFTAGLVSRAAENLPPVPPRYFNDYAGVVSRPVADALNAKLEQFERTNSSQLLVVIYPKMDSASSVEEYTTRVAQAWGVGQAKTDNGAVLFSFMQERQLYLQVGYGLEGVIPDVTAKRIIESEIVPRFRQNDIDGGMRAAVSAMIAAAQGEYKGTGRTQNDGRRQSAPGGLGVGAVILIFVLWGIFSRGRSRRNYVFGGPGAGWWVGSSGGRNNGGGWSSGGGGGGFSGGGGGFGGGGAGGRW